VQSKSFKSVEIRLRHKIHGYSRAKKTKLDSENVNDDWAQNIYLYYELCLYSKPMCLLCNECVPTVNGI